MGCTLDQLGRQQLCRAIHFELMRNPPNWDLLTLITLKSLIENYHIS